MDERASVPGYCSLHTEKTGLEPAQPPMSNAEADRGFCIGATPNHVPPCNSEVKHVSRSTSLYGVAFRDFPQILHATAGLLPRSGHECLFILLRDGVQPEDETAVK